MSWTNGVVPTYYRYHEPVTPADNPQNVPGSTVPTALAAPAQVPALAPLPTALPGTREYTDQLIKIAQVSEEVAARLKREYGDKKPEDDPVAWSMYTARRTVADHDWARVDQALAAELRTTYQGDPKNTQTVDNASRSLVARYGDVPDIQGRVTRALDRVKKETPLERDVDQRLIDVNDAGAKLDDLTFRQQSGADVSSAEITAARGDYEAKQQLLLTAVDKELGDKYTHLSTHVWLSELDPLGYAAGQIDRYGNDPELAVALRAAVIIRRVVSTEVLGNSAQMDKLTELLPRGVDPSLKRLVMSDSRIAKIPQEYVDTAVTKVADAYRTNGTVAGAQTLADVTDPLKHPGVSPEIAALIINKSMPTINQVLKDASTLQFKGKDGRAVGNQPNGEVQIARALSQAVESAARGSDPVRKQYDSSEIKSAIENVGRAVATHPNSTITTEGFKQSVGDGHATLALETVRQTRTLKRDDFEPGTHAYDYFRPEQLQARIETTMDAVDDGLKLLKENGNNIYKGVATDTAPLLAQGRYAGALTDEQFRNGLRGLTESDPTLKGKVQEGGRKLDKLGFDLVRTSEAVTFYSEELKGVHGLDHILGSRDALMSDETLKNVILLSDSAHFRMATQIARNMLSEDLKNGGAQAQYYGVGAQVIGDFSEFLAEEYVVKRVNVPAVGPDGQPLPLDKQKPVNLPGEPINVSRIAHLPYPTAVGIWGGGGALQAALTVYLADAVHIDGPGGDVRKAMLLGLVGGFAAFHLYQAGAAAVNIAPHSLGNGKVKWLADNTVDRALRWVGSTLFNAEKSGDMSWGLYVKSGTLRAEWTRHTIEATPGLVKSLVGLMALAVVWDASGVFFNATGMDATGRVNFKLATQSINLINDLILLRLQVREWAKKEVGQEVMTQAERYAADYMLQGLSKAQSRRLGASLVARTLGEEMLIRLGASAMLDWLGPVGWIVNIGYLVTTGANWAFDHNKNIETFERYDRTFLEHAGLHKPQADVMDEHGWWSSESKADGIVTGYLAMGGDPTKFIDYLNSLDPRTLGAVMTAAENLPDHVTDNGLPATQDESAFLSLPMDPTKVDVSKYTAISYNNRKQRYEDPVTQTYWLGGRWYYDATIGNDMGYIPPRTDNMVFYDPVQMGLMHNNGFLLPLQITSTSGLQNWMYANDIPRPA